MDKRTIFTKTAKGLAESTGKTKALSRDERKVISQVNGVMALKDLLIKLESFSEKKLTDILFRLKDDEYIREFNPPPVTGEDEARVPAEAKLEDALTALTMGAFWREVETAPKKSANPEASATIQNATEAAITQSIADAQAKMESENLVRREQDAREKKEKKEEEEKVRLQLEEKVKAKDQADAMARQKNEAEARQKAEEKKQLEAKLIEQERARVAAQELADKLAREKALEKKKVDDELARKIAEEKKEKEAEDRAWRKFEEKAKREAEEKARVEAERLTQILALQAAEEKAKREIEERAEIARQEAAAQELREMQLREKKEAEENLQRELEKIAAEFARQAREEQLKKEYEEARQKEAEAQAQRALLLRQEIEAREKAQEEAKQEERRLAQLEAERIAEEARRKKEEARLKKAAEDKARRDLEVSNRKAAAELARKKAQEKKDLAEKAKQAAQEKAKLEAEAMALLRAAQKKEAEELAQRQAEERRLKEAAKAQEKLEREEREQRHAEELLRLEFEEKRRIALEKALERKLEQEAIEAAEAAEEAQRREERRQLEIAQENERQLRLLAEEQEKQEAKARERDAAKDIADKLKEELIREKSSAAAIASELAAQKEDEQRRLHAIERENEAVRKEAADLSRDKADQRARQKLEEKNRRDEMHRVRRHRSDAEKKPGAHFYDTSHGWGVTILGLCLVVVASLFVWSKFSNFDERRAQFEKMASEQFGQQVKVGQLHFAFLPQPQWQLEEVVIGMKGQIKIKQVNALLDLGALSEKPTVYKSFEFVSPTVSEEGLAWVLFGKSHKQGLHAMLVNGSNIKFDTPHINLGFFDLTAEIGPDKAWKKMMLQSSGKEMSIELQTIDDSVRIKILSKTMAVPFGSSLSLDSFSAEGTLAEDAVMLSKFYGLIYDGVLTGNAKLTWNKGWTLNGDIRAKQIDAAKWLPDTFDGGEIEGGGKFIMQAQETAKLFATQRINGNFVARSGTIHGVNLVKHVQGGDNIGTSSFNDLTGWFSYDAGRIRLGSMKLSAGLLNAYGNVEVSAKQEINGRFSVNLENPVRNARVDLLVSGHLKKPRFDSAPSKDTD